jgi:decaprenylphospho-beta-D-erythro-pentofuranosid-2-ulose 2-reductase
MPAASREEDDVLDPFGQPQSVVVLGGTSDIAGAVVDRLCARRCRTVVLAGRDPDRLGIASARAKDAGASQVAEVVFDAREVTRAPATVDRCFVSAGDVDLVLIAVGVLSGRRDERDATHAADVAAVTYAWPVAAATRAAALLHDQGYGRIVVLSSVAGVRVRRANFLYGSAKAGLDVFALQLGDAAREGGVTVQVVRPGFVRTKMTAGIPAAPFATTPEEVADAVVAGLATSARVIWVPPVLGPLFALLNRLPEALWSRLPG